MNKIVKLVLSTLFLAGAIFLFYKGMIGWGMLALLLAAVSLFFFFINEYILLGFLQLRKQNMEGTRKWLSKITNPQKQLFEKSIGYFHYMNGLTNAQDNVALAEKNMKEALKHGLPFGHDKAIALVNLSAGAMRKGNRKDAERMLKEAREVDKQGLVREQIEMLEGQLTKVQQTKGQPTMGRRGRQVHGRSRYF